MTQSPTSRLRRSWVRLKNAGKCKSSSCSMWRTWWSRRATYRIGHIRSSEHGTKSMMAKASPILGIVAPPAVVLRKLSRCRFLIIRSTPQKVWKTKKAVAIKWRRCKASLPKASTLWTAKYSGKCCPNGKVTIWPSTWLNLKQARTWCLTTDPPLDQASSKK